MDAEAVVSAAVRLYEERGAFDARRAAMRFASWYGARSPDRRFWMAVEESIADATTHTSDAECTVGTDDVCIGCGVHHGDACPV